MRWDLRWTTRKMYTESYTDRFVFAQEISSVSLSHFHRLASCGGLTWPHTGRLSNLKTIVNTQETTYKWTDSIIIILNPLITHGRRFMQNTHLPCEVSLASTDMRSHRYWHDQSWLQRQYAVFGTVQVCNTRWLPGLLFLISYCGSSVGDRFLGFKIVQDSNRSSKMIILIPHTHKSPFTSLKSNEPFMQDPYNDHFLQRILFLPADFKLFVLAACCSCWQPGAVWAKTL